MFILYNVRIIPYYKSVLNMERKFKGLTQSQKESLIKDYENVCSND